MKKVLFETAKIVGTATQSSWSQVHTFSPTEAEKRKQRGDLLAVLSLKGLEEGVEAVAAGREVISRLHEEYYGNLQGSAFSRLKVAVEKVAGEAAAEAEIEIGAAAIIDKVLYLAIAGGGQVLFQRDSQMGIILQGDKATTAASGRLREEDLFLIGTAGFFKAVPSGVIKAALATGSPTEATETLAPAIHGRPKSGTVAAVLGQVKKAEASLPTEAQPTPPSPERKKFSRTELKAKLFNLLLGLQKRLGDKTIYLRRELRTRAAQPEKARRTAFTVAIVLLVLLGISLVLGSQQRKNLGLARQAAALLEEARTKKAEGEALLELNPSRARELLFEAKELVEQIEAEGGQGSELESFKNELAQILDQVWQEYQVETKVFFDLELIKQEAQGDDLAVSGGKMMILDQAKSVIYEVGMEDKKSALVAGGESLEGAFQVAAFLPKVFALTEKSIFEIDRLTKKEKRVATIETDQGQAIDFQAFGGNLYLLDQDSGLWQYPVTETGFGNRRAWLKGETPSGFSQAKSMAIDGSIWVLREDGFIWKFTRGEKDAFGMAGLDKSLVEPNLIYTDDDSENLYVLDKGNSRIVVLAKSGEYEASYYWSGLATTKGMAVSEEAGKIFLLEGNKIYEIDLKQ